MRGRRLMEESVVDLTEEDGGEDSLCDTPGSKDEMQVLGVVETQLRKAISQRDALNRQIDELTAEKSLLWSRFNAKKKKRKREEEDARDWESETFPFSSQVRDVLQRVYGLQAFRPQQLTVINATLSKVDCFAVMPTGYGKSLLYQIPALVNKNKLTLVVSPLISLSFDQVMNLQSKGISAAMLSAATSKSSYSETISDMESGRLQFLYVTPEKILKSKRFLAKLEKMYARDGLARIVIDEAHCCATMGHDFRPDYQKLFILRRQFPKAPILAVTATATYQAQHEVRQVLLGESSIADDWKVVRLSFNRPNLFYSVVEKPDKGAQADELVVEIITERFAGESGIVYVFARREAEALSVFLCSKGVKAAAYHAYISDAAKSNIHQGWKTGRLHVIVATSAFGMGIDKTDVRFVLHHSLPKNMEAYTQESGRAGRDGKESHCVLLYRRGDILRVSTLLSESARGENQILQLVKYAEELHQCRRSAMAKSFGEQGTFNPSVHCKSKCDNCLAGCQEKQQSASLHDVTAQALIVFHAWEDMSAKDPNQRVTMNQLLDTVRGVGKLAKLTEHRCPKGWRKRDVEKLVVHMLLARVFRIKWVYTAYTTNTYIGKGHNAGSLMGKGLKVQLQNTGTAS